MKQRQHRQQTHAKKLGITLAWCYKYWVTIALLFVLATLIWQNFIFNEFPKSLHKKQHNIEQKIALNQTLEAENKANKPTVDMEILQSQARYRFNLIKPGEIYYTFSNPLKNP